MRARAGAAVAALAEQGVAVLQPLHAGESAAVEAGVKAKEDYSNRVTLVQKELQAKVAAGDKNALDNY